MKFVVLSHADHRHSSHAGVAHADLCLEVARCNVAGLAQRVSGGFSGVGIIRKNVEHLRRELGRRCRARGRIKRARMVPATPTNAVNWAVARGASVGAVVTLVPTIVETTSTIVSCKTEKP